METTITKRNAAAALVAGLVGAVGLATAGVALMWVAGFLGISAAAATQVVDAIVAGGAALAVVMAIFGAGVIGAIVFTVRTMVVRFGSAVAIA